MTRPANIKGERFGRLSVLNRGDNDKHGKARWVCRCDCGGTATVGAAQLKRGLTRSCGCLHVETISALRRTHGKSGTVEHKIWKQMIQRCTNTNNPSYCHYGGRGIVVCERWRHCFENFLADMGQRPPLLQLDRINNNGPYSPENCRWATIKQQRRNTRANLWLVWKGKRMTIAEAAEHAGLKYATLAGRLRRGWSVSKAMAEPIREW